MEHKDTDYRCCCHASWRRPPVRFSFGNLKLPNGQPEALITTLSNCDQKTGVIVAISSILCLVFVVTFLGKWNTKTRISGVAATLVGAAFLFGFSRYCPELPAASNGQPQTVVQAPIEKQDKERKEGSGDTGKSKEKDSPQVIAKQPEKIDGQVVKTPDKPN